MFKKRVFAAYDLSPEAHFSLIIGRYIMLASLRVFPADMNAPLTLPQFSAAAVDAVLSYTVRYDSGYFPSLLSLPSTASRARRNKS